MTDYPIRQRSANGKPPARQFLRRCYRCGADFLGLAAGKTGEAGLWDGSRGMRWWCSQECYDHDHTSLPVGSQRAGRSGTATTTHQ